MHDNNVLKDNTSFLVSVPNLNVKTYILEITDYLRNNRLEDILYLQYYVVTSVMNLKRKDKNNLMV